jgi:hypothetical protein
MRPARPSSIRETFLEMAAMDGSTLGFALLEDGRCAILEEGSITAVHDGDDASLGRALRAYFKLCARHGGTPSTRRKPRGTRTRGRGENRRLAPRRGAGTARYNETRPGSPR